MFFCAFAAAKAQDSPVKEKFTYVAGVGYFPFHHISLDGGYSFPNYREIELNVHGLFHRNLLRHSFMGYLSFYPFKKRERKS